jgi:hypothetical protein
MNALSFCRWTSVSCMTFLMHLFQDLAWKQYFLFSLNFETGGNWKKSPLNINCIPPNAQLLLRIVLVKIWNFFY